MSACAGQPETIPVLVDRGGNELQQRIAGGAELAIGGEALNTERLRRFYARHDFEMIWPSREEQATSLIASVTRARDHGLDPALFHADLLRRRTTLAPLDRDLLMSDAFLSYADALAHGAVLTDRRRDNETLAPEPVDVVARLDQAIGSPDPGAAIEALAPATTAYRVLRQSLPRYRAGAAAGNRVAQARLRAIEVNLERLRWLPRPLPADFAWVNVADQRLVLYRTYRPVFSTRVVVGDDAERNQSPEFRAVIEASFVNPPWVIPRDIVDAEILPRLSRDPDYLTRNNMVLHVNGEIEQAAGPEAGLGFIMFDMPNRFDVYLHDTPNRRVFARDNRRISHGCIRVENPREFAAMLMQEPIETIDQWIATGSTTRNTLPIPVPVFVTYQTAFVDTEGAVQFRPDFYNRDSAIWQLLQRRPQPAPAPAPTQVDNRPVSPGPA
ncbi:L,D-transpeptidase family protein [Roseococcus sp. YIM B11640]|uniref:L,D-transpeptidase family protein n=1 Tax=Roseococcus sp. YIM B11640 TaxID=3133973 RepID=UPI003C7ED7EC